MQIQAGIITVSDRASQGVYDDRGGPALKAATEAYGWKVLAEALVPDEKQEIQRAVREQAARGCHLVLTTGGTGVALRDVTPEAVREIGGRELPGFGEVMRMESYKITPHSIISRAMAGIRKESLIINLPGSPKAATECLGFVLGAIPHALSKMKGDPADCGS